jgi:hypothetical protein
MTLTADEKGSLTCRELFPPLAHFEAETDEAGRVVLTKLPAPETPAKLVKPIQYKGFWIMPGKVDAEKLTEELQQERERRDANFLGESSWETIPTEWV